MKRSIYLILSLTVILLLSACSSVKVLDAWKTDNVTAFKDNNILVIARTSNKSARIAFEEEIANALRARGMKATESFTRFPNMKPNEKVTEDKRNMIMDILNYEGYNGIVLTVIKDVQLETKTYTSGGYYPGGSYASFYPGYYGGFYGYYHHPYSYSSYGYYVPETTTIRTSKTYVLETVIYDLDQEGNEQLVAVVTSTISDPKKAHKAAKEYVEAITKSLDAK
ncbi:MAG: hypothetical protein O6943_11895 [Bacteroidetes bacterium]|nr:hypothetical protein [Bacteroidota bacterium]